MASIDVRNAVDSWGWDSGPTQNWETFGELWCGLEGGVLTRAWIKFDWTGIPVDDEIVSAVVTLKMNGAFNGQTDLKLHRALQPWDVSEVTWNEYSTGNNWATAGGQSGTDYEASALVSVDVEEGNQSGDVVFTLPSGSGVTMADLDNGNGWFLIGTQVQTNSLDTKRTFYSTDDATESNRPRLQVTSSAAAPPGPTTDTYDVSNGLTDAYWNDAALVDDGLALQVGYITDGGNNRRIALNFAGVTLAAGRVITLAELDIVDYWTEDSFSPSPFRFAAENAADPTLPTDPTDGNGRFSSPGLTSATGTDSSIGAEGQTAGTVLTLTVTSIVDELYNTYDYSGGAAMQFFLYEIASPVDGTLALFGASEHGDEDYRPVLRITHDAAGGGGEDVVDTIGGGIVPVLR